MSNIPISLLTTDSYQRWDDYVQRSSTGTFFHLSPWVDILESAFGFKPYYCYVEHNNKITGVLPLFLTYGLLAGRKLISSPFCVYAGVIANDSTTRDLLLNYAVTLGEKLDVKYLEIRSLAYQHPDWPTSSNYFTFRKQLSSDLNENFLAIPRKQRAMVRKGEEAGLVYTISNDIEGFYRLYAASVHRLGTPVYPRKYFECLYEAFKDSCDILVVKKDDNLITAVLSFYFKDQVLPYYAGGEVEARDLKAFDFMYWKLMCHALEQGIGIFDFGRSIQGTGSYAFKKNWGFEPEPLFYQYRLYGTQTMPDISPHNPRYKLAASLWKFLPLSVANRLGPGLSRLLA